MEASYITSSLLALFLCQTFFVRTGKSSIRSIDFTNFRYPAKGANLAYNSRRKGNVYRLRQSELPPKFGKRNRVLNVWLKFVSVSYGDLTGDGNEEAIVDLEWITGGSAIPDLVYIYALRRKHPALLWAFTTGDRADGGLKRVYAESGHLVLELYGKDKVIGKNLYTDDGTKQGDCCPTVFTRTRYVWRNGRFNREGKAVVLPLPKDLKPPESFVLVCLGSLCLRPEECNRVYCFLI